MGAASDKRGRGRPPKFTPDLYRAAADEGPRTRRGRQDRLYARRAILLLRERFPDPEGRSWLFNEFNAEAAKWSILAELGRMAEQRGEAFWPAVEWVLERRPKTKDAVKQLRAVRTGKPQPLPDPGRAILKLLEPYPDPVAIEALERVLLAYLADESSQD